MSDNFFSTVFFLGALWNIGIGLAGILFYELTSVLFFGPGALPNNFMSGLFYRLFMMAVIAFGIGYFIVSRDLSQNRAIVWLGLACKMILLVVFTGLFLAGRATILALLTVTGDLAWSLLFLLFLRQTRDRVRKSNLIG